MNFFYHFPAEGTAWLWGEAWMCSSSYTGWAIKWREKGHSAKQRGKPIWQYRCIFSFFCWHCSTSCKLYIEKTRDLIFFQVSKLRDLSIGNFLYSKILLKLPMLSILIMSMLVASEMELKENCYIWGTKRSSSALFSRARSWIAAILSMPVGWPCNLYN